MDAFTTTQGLHIMDLLLALVLVSQKPSVPPQPTEPINRSGDRRLALVVTVTRADCKAQDGVPVNDGRKEKKDSDIVRCSVSTNFSPSRIN